MYEAGDLRKDWLICKEVYDAAGNVSASYPGKLTYPFCRKYIDPDFVGDKTSTKPFLMRYSDIALTYAEAAGPTDKAYALVNAIRNRAGLGDLPAGLDKSAFRQAVIRERITELAFEGNRFGDLTRIARHKNLAGFYQSNYGSKWLADKLAYKNPKVSLLEEKNWYLPLK